MVNVIFLHYRGAPYTKKILAILRNFDLNIRAIEAKPEIVSNFVPNALKRGAKSWLIFFLPSKQEESNKQEELLILPFPDKNHRQHFGYPPNFRGYLADLIPTAARCLRSTDEDFYVPLEWIGQFQYIRHDSSLNTLLKDVLDDQISHSEVQEIQETLIEISRNIQEQRTQILREALKLERTERSIPIAHFDNTIARLENALVIQNEKLCELVRQRHITEVVPPIVKRFKNIMDPETKRFLISSETVSRFVYHHSPTDFDYSLPGCGLWKAVERELNLSLVLHMRRAKGILQIEDPWQSIKDGPVKIETGSQESGHTLDLNKSEPRSRRKLKGITLGSMKYMLMWGDINGVYDELEKLSISDARLEYLLGPYSESEPIVTRDTLPWCLEKIAALRNGHAHVSAMSRTQFEKLRNLILPSETGLDTCLVKILQLKKKVFEYSNSS